MSVFRHYGSRLPSTLRWRERSYLPRFYDAAPGHLFHWPGAQPQSGSCPDWLVCSVFPVCFSFRDAPSKIHRRGLLDAAFPWNQAVFGSYSGTECRQHTLRCRHLRCTTPIDSLHTQCGLTTNQMEPNPRCNALLFVRTDRGYIYFIPN